jgi:hypothetical protein
MAHIPEHIDIDEEDLRKAFDAAPEPVDPAAGLLGEPAPTPDPEGPQLRDPGLAGEVGQAELGEGGLDDFFARLDIAQSQVIEEKILAFRKHFPEGNLVVARDPTEPSRVLGAREQALVPGPDLGVLGGGPPVLLFREDQSRPYRRVDDKSQRFNEVVLDLVDFFGPDLGAILGAIAPIGKVATGARGLINMIPAVARSLQKARNARIRGFHSGRPVGAIDEPLPPAPGLPGAPAGEPGPRGRLIGAAGRGAIGAGLGELTQESLQQARDIATEDLTTVAGRAAVQASIEGISTKIFGVPLQAAANMFRRAGIFGLATGGRATLESAQRLGTGELPLNLVMASPLIRRLANQSASIVNTLPAQRDMIEVGMVRLVDLYGTRGMDDPVKASLDTLSRIARDEEGILIREVFAEAGRSGASLTQGSQALARGIANWDYGARALEDVAYKKVRSEFGTPQFNTDPLQAVLNDQQELISKLPSGTDRTALNDLIRQVSDLIGSRRGADPERLARLQADAAAQPDVLGLQTVAREEAKKGPLTIPDIRQSDGTILDATDQLRFQRTTAGDLSTPQLGQRSTQANRIAGTIRNAIGDVLDNPTNADEGFQAAWATVTRDAAQRRRVRDQVLLVEIMQRVKAAPTSSEPLNIRFDPAAQTLVARLGNFSNPENIANWKLLKRIMPIDDIEGVRNAIFAEMLEDPSRILPRLRGTGTQANQEVAREVFSPRDIKALEEMGIAWTSWMRTGIPETLKRQGGLAQTIAQQAARADEVGVKGIHTVIMNNGGLESPLGNVTRRSLFNHFAVNGTVFKGGARRVDIGKWRSLIDEFEESGASRFFLPSEWQFIKDVRNVQDFLTAAADVGASMHGASTGRGLIKFNPIAIKSVFENFFIGWAFTNKTLRGLLVGQPGRKQLQSDLLQQVAGVLALGVNDAQKTQVATVDIIKSFNEDPNRVLGAAVGGAFGGILMGPAGVLPFAAVGALAGPKIGMALAPGTKTVQ